MKVGFVGLGIMGKPMAKNLVKGGFDLVVSDLVKPAVDELVAMGATAAASAKELAEQCDIIVTMLPNSPHVKAVVMGPNGVLEGAKKGTLLVDMSSIAPVASQEIAKACNEKGVEMIDAPVSGGDVGATNGTLAIMVGGSKANVDRALPVLEKMGSKITHCGEVGAGNITKLANQVIVGVNLIGVCEALALAKKAGANAETVFDAIKEGAAGSFIMNLKGRQILDGNINPGFRLELHMKDLQNALDTGHTIGAPMPITSVIMELMHVVKAEYGGAIDNCGVVKYYEKIIGCSIN
jgi:2-hydroxy-3-oxopropionate reductase